MLGLCVHYGVLSRFLEGTAMAALMAEMLWLPYVDLSAHIRQLIVNSGCTFGSLYRQELGGGVCSTAKYGILCSDSSTLCTQAVDNVFLICQPQSTEHDIIHTLQNLAMISQGLALCTQSTGFCRTSLSMCLL